MHRSSYQISFTNLYLYVCTFVLHRNVYDTLSLYYQFSFCYDLINLTIFKLRKKWKMENGKKKVRTSTTVFSLINASI